MAGVGSYDRRFGRRSSIAKDYVVKYSPTEGNGAVAAPSPTPIADFDFSTPVTANDFTSVYATDEWVLQSPTAGSYANNVGSATLDNTGGLEDQEAIGLYDGTDLVSETAWEALDGGDYLECSSTTPSDFNGVDFAVRIVFRAPGPAISGDWFCGNYDGTTGWGIYTSGTNLRFYLVDATAGIKALTIHTAASDFFDNAIHVINIWYDDSTETMYAKTDLTSEVSAVHTGNDGNFANSALMKLNGRAGVTGSGHGNGLQAIYLGLCSGANAQNFYSDAVFVHATDPTGLLETIDRDCLISVPVSASRVAHFGPNQLPIGYHSAFSSGYALYCNSDVTNLLTYSELLSNWTNKSGTPTVTDKAGDAPDGFRRATSITAGAANDQQGLNFTTVAATEYTLSIWVKRNGGSDVSGRLIFYNETGTAELAAQAFTATATWQLVKVTATTAAGQVSSSIRVEVDTSSESVFAWGAQANAGDGRGAYIRTEGATASLVVPDYSRDTDDAVDTAEGELLLVSVLALDIPGATRTWFDRADATTDQRRTDITSSGAVTGFLRRSGSTEATVSTGQSHGLDTKRTTALQWGASLSTPELRTIFEGTNYDSTDNQPYENSTTLSLTDLRLGSQQALSNAVDGWIQSLKSYDQLVTSGV